MEHLHFDVRQALFKACNSVQSKWASVAYSIFWADCITTCRWMGCSPYFAVIGTHPLLLFDISEAMYLLIPPDFILSTEDLISCCTIALQKCWEHLSHLHSKVYEALLAAATCFKKEHSNTIKDFNFKLGDLVLIRHMAIKKVLNHKIHWGACCISRSKYNTTQERLVKSFYNNARDKSMCQALQINDQDS